jgi:hypothetical protein
MPGRPGREASRAKLFLRIGPAGEIVVPPSSILGGTVCGRLLCFCLLLLLQSRHRPGRLCGSHLTAGRSVARSKSAPGQGKMRGTIPPDLNHRRWTVSSTRRLHE